MKDFVVKRSSAGLGLFATRDFKKGELVIEYIGTVVSEEEAQKIGGKYLFELNDKWNIDGKGRKNIARYINHSCKPNCYPELNDEETRIFIYTKHAIEAGEEFTYNYGKSHFDIEIKPHGCRCDACSKRLSFK